jgi:hypothetical protein
MWFSPIPFDIARPIRRRVTANDFSAFSEARVSCVNLVQTYLFISFVLLHRKMFSILHVKIGIRSMKLLPVSVSDYAALDETEAASFCLSFGYWYCLALLSV